MRSVRGRGALSYVEGEHPGSQRSFVSAGLGSLAAARSRVRGRSGLVPVPLRLNDSETVASDLFASVVQALDLAQFCAA